MSIGSRSTSVRRRDQVDRFERRARSPCFPLVVAAFPLLLSPAFGAGWIIDDYFHRTVMLRTRRFASCSARRRRCSGFFAAIRSACARLMDTGVFPGGPTQR